MLNKIIHFSLQNRILVLVASVLLLIGGTYTAMHTEVDVFPDLNAPTVVIMTEANGMAAEEVEQLVTFPVETAVNGATGVRRVRSSSTNGFSVVWVEFDWGTDIYLARQIVSEKLAIVGEELPSNVGKPTLGPQSSILGEVLIIGLTADSTSMLDLRTIADWTIRPRLLSTGGVAQVAVLGGELKEYQIQLDPERMRHYSVSMNEVMTVTRGMNLNANGGVLYEYGNEYIVRGVLSTAKVDQLGKAVVKSINSVPVLLEDIADVRIGPKAPKLGTASERGKPAVLMTVTKQPSTSTLEPVSYTHLDVYKRQVYALCTSKKAHAVIKTSVDLSRQDEGEENFGSTPIARTLVRFSLTLANGISRITPESAKRWMDTRFRKDEAIIADGAAFDLVRASVNLVLAGLLIAVGTSLKLPLSTTYVTFMVAMGTSLADRAWGRDSAVYRITGVLSVIGGWFITAGAAFTICFFVAMIIHFGGSIAIIALIGLCLLYTSRCV